MRSELGQSMIELMVSIVIITTALSGIIAIFPYIIQKNVKIKMQTEAVNIAQSEVEKLKALSYYDEKLNALALPEGMSITEKKGDYLVRTTIKYVDSALCKVPSSYPNEISQDTGLKEISVSVIREDRAISQVDIVTYISKAKPGKG